MRKIGLVILIIAVVAALIIPAIIKNQSVEETFSNEPG